MKYGAFEIDFNALAALITAGIAAYTAWKGRKTSKAAKAAKKDQDHEKAE